MAKIELNIVALGDFSSVNSQIKALQAQVALLQKGMDNVAIDSSLARNLNNISKGFSQALTATGQFNLSTVQTTSEIENFGKSLQKGTLGLNNYFNILSRKNSAATTSVKELALEQTKLQNSVIMADPSRQGFYSVFTPKTINAVSNATKIAANEQNIYNIAVNKGSQALINWGKNTQWAGRQLTVGMSVPLIIFGSTATKVFKDVNEQLVRLQKVYGTGLTQPTKQVLDSIKKDVIGLAQELASTMGISAKDTAQMAADLAATGKTGNDLLGATRQAMRLQKLGEMDTQTAMQTTISLQNVYKLNTNELSDAINFLNAVENQTSTSLQDLAAGIPRVGPIVEQLGGSFKDTAIMMVAMKEAGVPAAQSANAIKSALASLINPTKAAKEAFAAYNINLPGILTSSKGNPVQMIMQLQQALKGLAPLAQAQLIEKLFGKFQEARIQALITNLGAANSQTKTAFDLMNANSSQLSSIAANEMKTATESVTGKYQRAIETFKADLIPVGQKLMEIATGLLNFANSVSKLFGGLPGPLKSVMGALAIGVALSGPIIMLTGLLGNFVGYLVKGVFNLRQLATGGKTLGQLLTPELIAAQNANELFNSGLVTSVDEVDLLNSAIKQLTISIQELVGSMNMGAGIGNLTSAVRKFSKGGIVPGSGNTDSVPAMLTPGELIVPKDQVEDVRAAYGGNFYYKSKSGNIRKRTDVQLAHLNQAANLSSYPSQEQSLIRQDTGAPENKNARVEDATHAAWHTEINQLTNSGTLTPQQMIKYLKGGNMTVGNGGELNPNMQITDAMGNPTSRSITHNPERAYGHLMNTMGINDPAARKSFATDLDKKLVNHLESLPASVKALSDLPTKTSQASAAAFGKVFKDTAQAHGYSTAALEKPQEIRVTGASGSGSTRYFSKSNESYSASLAKVLGGRSNKSTLDTIGNINKESFASQLGTQSAIDAGKNFSASVAQGIKQETKQVVTAVEEQTKAAVQATSLGEALASGSNGGLLAKGKGILTKPSGGLSTTGKMAGAASLMIAGPMLSGMLPKGSNAQSITSSAATMAGMGMMFGVEGAAIGAALGVAIGGFSALMKAEKEHQQVIRSTFTASENAIHLFGGTVKTAESKVITFSTAIAGSGSEAIKAKTEIDKYVEALSKLPKTDSNAITAKAIAGYNSPKAIIGTLKTQAAANVAAGMDPAGVKNMVSAMLQLAGKSNLTAAALREIIPATKDVEAANQTLTQKLVANAKTLRDWVEPLTVSYSSLNTSQQALADQFQSLAVDAITSSTSMKQTNINIKNITSSGLSATDQLGYLRAGLLAAGQTPLANQLIKINEAGVNLANSLNIAKVAAAGLFANQNVQIDGKTVNLDSPNGWRYLNEHPEILQGYLDKLDKANAAKEGKKPKVTTGKDSITSTVDAATVLEKKYKSLIHSDQARITYLERQDKLMNDQNQKAQDAIDLATKQTDLQNQIRKAIAGGDYLQANLLQQNMLANQDTYNQKIITNANTTKMDTLKQNLADIQDKISQGIDPGSKAVKDLVKATNATKLGTYHLGTVNVPSAVQYGSAAQMGVAANNSPNFNIVINGSGLNQQQLTAAMQDFYNKVKVQNGMSQTRSKVG